MSIDYNNNIIFIHIPKTGGSSINKYFFNQNLVFNTGKHRGIKYYKDNNFDLSKFYIFTVVRHPYSRMVSYYKYIEQILHKKMDMSFSDWIKNPIGDKKFLFRPQYQWVDESVKIFKFEDGIPNIIDQVKRDTQFDCDRKIKHINKTKNHIELSVEDKKNIYQKYYLDFQKFNYKP